MYPCKSTEATRLNRCKSEKNLKPALSSISNPRFHFNPYFPFAAPFCKTPSDCSSAQVQPPCTELDAARELQSGPRVLLGSKADRKNPQGQLCKCLVFSSDARVLQSAHYKSCGKSDSVEKCLNWSRSFLEVGFSVCHEPLYFQILIFGYWIFISQLVAN